MSTDYYSKNVLAMIQCPASVISRHKQFDDVIIFKGDPQGSTQNYTITWQFV